MDEEKCNHSIMTFQQTDFEKSPHQDIYCNILMCNCNDQFDCYYKQLKRKEQVCETFQMLYTSTKTKLLTRDKAIIELRQKINYLTLENQEAKEIIAELKAENAVLKQRVEVAIKHFNAILDDEDKPACYNSDDCILHYGAGLDNHCNEKCPFVIAVEMLNEMT